MALQHLRSSTAHKRPIPTQLSAGQIAVNTNEASPGLFFKDSNGDLVKIGPVHVGENAPNSSPASTAATAIVSGTTYQILTVGTTDFTAIGASANTVGTIFTATGVGTGTGTVSGQQGVEKGEQWLDTTGGTYVLKIYDGSAWRSESGTFVDSAGDTMTGALLLDNAASASAPDLSFDGDANTGIYSPGADQVAIATGGVGRLFVDSNGDVKIEDTSADSAAGPEFSLYRNSASPADGDYLGQIRFEGENDTGGKKLYAKVTGKTSDVSAGSEDGLIETAVIKAGSQTIVSRQTGTDLKLINGTGLQVDGNVGIGTSSPTSRVHALSGASDNPHFYFKSTVSTGTDNSGDLFKIEHSRGTGFDNALLNVLNSAGSVLYVEGTGNIGIGTSSPDRALHVSSADNTRAKIAAGTTSHFGQLYLGDEDKFIIGYGSTHSQADTLALKNDTGDIYFATGTTAAQERLRIDSSGNVGIGTTSPSSPGSYAKTLQVSDANSASIVLSRTNTGTAHSLELGAFSGASLIESTGATSLRFKVNSSERMRIDSSGRVGIGASNNSSYDSAAQNLLVADESGNTGITIRSGGSTPFGAIQFADGTSSNAEKRAGRIMYGHSGDFMSFSTANSEAMRIDSSGRLLVGTSSSAGNALLQIQGDAASSLHGASLFMRRGEAPASISSGELIGQILFTDNAGGGFGSIECEADAAAGSGDYPGRLVFSTSADGASSPTERMRIDSSGMVRINGDAASDQPGHIELSGGGSSVVNGQEFGKISFRTQDSNVAGSDKDRKSVV